MFVLTLIYENGDRFIVGGFDSLEKANDWVDIEKTRPYWVESTEIQIDDFSNNPSI